MIITFLVFRLIINVLIASRFQIIENSSNSLSVYDKITIN